MPHAVLVVSREKWCVCDVRVFQINRFISALVYTFKRKRKKFFGQKIAIFSISHGVADKREPAQLDWRIESEWTVIGDGKPEGKRGGEEKSSVLNWIEFYSVSLGLTKT